MTRTIFATAATLVLAAMLMAAPAQAQNNRSFVSGHGSDSNPCTLAAPCRSFQQAHDMTNPSGEIDVLDPAGYGPLIITKAISIINDGVGTSSILVPSGGAGIAINAGAGDAVNLRGLTVEGGGVGHNGIQFALGKSLTIQNCFIRNLTNRGIEFAPAGDSSLAVSDTLVADNGVRGIIVAPTAPGTVTAIFNRVAVNNNGLVGITTTKQNDAGRIRVIVTDSVVSNSPTGIYNLNGAIFGQEIITVVRTTIANNGTGLIADGVAAILLTQSTITGNGTSFSAPNNGYIVSGQDNTIEFNFDGNPAPRNTYTKK